MKHLSFFFFLSVILLSSCKTSVKTNKLSDYNKQIKDNISVYIAVMADGKSKTKFAEGLKDKLISEFADRDIEADITILETDKSKSSHDFRPEDIKTNNANGLTLLISESAKFEYTRSTFYGWTMRLTDHNLKRDVWVSEQLKTAISGIGSAPNAVSKIILNSLKRDNLLSK